MSPVFTLTLPNRIDASGGSACHAPALGLITRRIRFALRKSNHYEKVASLAGRRACDALASPSQEDTRRG